jgi:hypothetical protein
LVWAQFGARRSHRRSMMVRNISYNAPHFCKSLILLV